VSENESAFLSESLRKGDKEEIMKKAKANVSGSLRTEYRLALGDRKKALKMVEEVEGDAASVLGRNLDIDEEIMRNPRVAFFKSTSKEESIVKIRMKVRSPGILRSFGRGSFRRMVSSFNNAWVSQCMTARDITQEIRDEVISKEVIDELTSRYGTKLSSAIMKSVGKFTMLGLLIAEKKKKVANVLIPMDDFQERCVFPRFESYVTRLSRTEHERSVESIC